MKIAQPFLVTSVLCICATPLAAAAILWKPVNGDVEFSVTSDLNGAPVESPSAFESGYNGGWWFDGSEVAGIGQTFTVSSSRVLDSVSLRLGRFDTHHPTGQLEVAIFRFDAPTQSPSVKLASILVNADAYNFDILSTPRSSFDFSSFHVPLDPATIYSLAVIPTASFAGGLMQLQSSLIYGGGSAYSLTFVVPEPASITLCSLGAILAALHLCRRPTSQNRV